MEEPNKDAINEIDLIEQEPIEDEKISEDFAKTIFDTFNTFIKISFIMGGVILVESIIIAVLICK